MLQGPPKPPSTWQRFGARCRSPHSLFFQTSPPPKNSSQHTLLQLLFTESRQPHQLPTTSNSCHLLSTHCAMTIEHTQVALQDSQSARDMATSFSQLARANERANRTTEIWTASSVSQDVHSGVPC